MKRHRFTSLAFASVLFFASCQGGSEPAYDPSIVVPHKDSAKAAATAPVTLDSAAAAQAVTAQPAATTATAPGMNPPHGQPGHRCDIAVGAPLNSKPAAPAAATTVTPTATPTITQTKTKTAPGMNPPHGEPGHRCDIAVGAPLNSKPTATTDVKQVTPAATPAAAPATQAAPKVDAQPAPAEAEKKP